MTPESSYLVCATPRSGSTLVCQALKDTGVAGTPGGVLRGAPAQRQASPPGGVLQRASTTARSSTTSASAGSATTRRLGRRSGAGPRTTATSSGRWRPGRPRTAIFGAKLMWGYFGDFVSLLRNIPALQRPAARRAAAGGVPEPDLRPRRAGEQGSPGGLALEGRADRDLAPGEGRRSATPAVGDGGTPPYKAFLEEHRPQLRFHYRAIAHLLDQILAEEAFWDAFFEHCEDQAGAGPVRELRRRSRGQHVERARAPGVSSRPTTSASSRG